jgi:hypothetical protein
VKEAAVKRTAVTLSIALALLPAAARAADERGFSVAVLVDGMERQEYAARGSFYVEALRGRDYELRITNPLPYRVAVALSVDGLNTIDAKRTEAFAASKWVLEPYASMVVPGWQVNGATARRFTFTTEARSYGAWLGKTQDLGVIEAVFFREKEREPSPYRLAEPPYDSRRDEPRPMGSAAPPSGAVREKAAEGAPRAVPKPQLSDEYAATGMGDRTSHSVREVDIALVKEPVARLRVRYEYRPELVRLGVLPPEYRPRRDPLDRREHATGFASWCPEPDAR